MIKSIILSGGWGYGNIGDEAILKYTYFDLERYFPNIPITVLTYDKEVTEYHHRFQPYENLHILLKKNAGARIIDVCKQIIKTGSCPKYLSEYCKYFENDVLFIMAGGGYFNDHWEESFFVHLTEIVIAKRYNAKVAIIGQTIGPISGLEHKTTFKEIVSAVDYIDVRDRTSFNFLCMLLHEKKVHLSCDAVIRNGSEQQRSTDEKIIGVMFQRKRPYTNPTTSKLVYRCRQLLHIITGQSKRFTDNLCDLIREILKENPDYKVIFVQSTDWREDEIQKIKERSGAKEVYVNCTVDEYISLICRCSAVITTNMHPAILATTVGVPAVAISHTYKIDDYMELCGMKEYAIHNIDVSIVKQYINTLLCSNDVTDKLHRSNKELLSKLDETYLELRHFSV